MKTNSIKQTITFSTDPKSLYYLIMDPKKHAAFTGSKVTMNQKVNGKFSVFDGYCRGYNVELVEGEKIVQAWHFEEVGWPDDHYSVCTFVFEKKGNKTKLTFTQTSIPEHKVAELKDGWKQYYWNPMKEYLKSN